MLPAFNWIIDARLAGSGRPGLLADLDDDLRFLSEQGIRTIFTLTEERVPGLSARQELSVLHFPIPDMGFPMPRACSHLCRRVLERLEDGPVLIHCHAGLGRTGTIAACCLVTLGHDPEGALARVRRINGRYVQTPSQEQFIHHYAEHLTRPG